MPILAAVRKGEAGRVAGAEGRPVHDLRLQAKRARGACADAWWEQQVLEILGRLIGCGGQRAAQAAGADVAWANGVMRGHDEMQTELARRAVGHGLGRERRELVSDTVGT